MAHGPDARPTDYATNPPLPCCCRGGAVHACADQCGVAGATARDRQNGYPPEPKVYTLDTWAWVFVAIWLGYAIALGLIAAPWVILFTLPATLDYHWLNIPVAAGAALSLVTVVVNVIRQRTARQHWNELNAGIQFRIRTESAALSGVDGADPAQS